MPIARLPLRQIQGSSESYKDLGEQLINMSIPFQEEVIAAEGQQMFTLSQPFTTGTKQLKVYVNGVLQMEGEQGGYVELNSTTVMFTEPLKAGDVVVFRIEGAGSGVVPLIRQRKFRVPVIGTVDGVNKVFQIPEDIVPDSEEVFVNGLLMDKGPDNDYVISGRTITFNEAPPVGAKILVSYYPAI